ncbi:MAG TPA: GNAT family N-acetyltransferase, partial [Gaiellaceae bacterium]|nr:GNAT family N-acetyltransferase [Gaiellaceae bacterium]
ASGPESERFDSPDVAALAAAQQEEMRGLYEGEADIGPTRAAPMFEPPHGAFFVIRRDGRAVACGGIARFDATRGEVKRMYVVPEARGLGLGRRILEAIEEEAVRLGYVALVLETGDRQPEALGLYRSSGYEPIPCYPPYDSRALSVCFEKLLPARE